MIRLFLPNRFNLTYAVGFAGLLFCMQRLQHTTLYFSACCFLFIVISTLAFNAAGGLTRPSGGYIFFYATLGVIVGLCTKVMLGERGDSNLFVPQLTITIYLVGSCGLWLAAIASRHLSRRRPFLTNVVSDRNLPNATIGCLFVGLVLTTLSQSVGRTQGSALSILLQINRFSELTIILGVTSVIRRSGGRRSISIPVLMAGASLFVIGGILGFSKQGLFTPLACWVFAAAAQGYRLGKGQIIGLLLAAFFVSHYLVPYSQYGRSFESGSLVGNIDVATRLLSDLGKTRKQYEALALEGEDAEGTGRYFNKPQGILDRLQMIAPDDALNYATLTKGQFGYLPMLVDFENLVPHFLWPGKPNYQWGNVYAHEAGVGIPEEDFTTGISFSPTGEAYHLGGWLGVIFLAPLVWIMGFIAFDSLCGDVRESPWGLLMLTVFAHIAPEGLLGGLIYTTFYVGFAIIFAALMTGYLMPILGSLFAGPGRRTDLTRRIGVLPRIAPADPAESAQS